MKENILLIDDNGEFRRLMEIFLSGKFKVKTCENGQEALMMLQNGEIPDLIVSDYIMPVMDGKGLITRLRDNNLFKHIPVIIITSVNSSNTRAELIESGASNYLVKPFSLAELELCIRNLLNVRV